MRRPQAGTQDGICTLKSKTKHQLYKVKLENWNWSGGGDVDLTFDTEAKSAWNPNLVGGRWLT